MVAGGATVVVVIVLSWLAFSNGDADPSDSLLVGENGSVEASSATAITSPPAPPTGTTNGSGESPADGVSSATTSAAPETTTTTLLPRNCEPALPRSGPAHTPVLVDLVGDDPAEVAIAISRQLHTCADDLVVADPLDLYSATVAAQLAARFSSPLLYYLPSSEDSLSAELRRLAPRRIWLMEGIPDSVRSDGAEVIRMPSGSEELIEWMSLYDPTVVTGASPVSGDEALHSLVITGEGLGIVLAPRSGLTVAPPSASGLVMGSTGRATGSSRLWLVEPERPAAGLAVAAAVAALGETALYWNPEGTFGWDEAAGVLEEETEGMAELWTVGSFSDSARWLFESMLWATELPGGGRIMFPDRRLVAFYGVPDAGSLGVLGEQGPSETLERLAPYLEEYAADGVPTIPTFEIIATVAHSRPGRDGDYSGEVSVERLLPWIEFAAREGIYVVLDLQPGRTDFLTQARYYEELLAFPHVGLALDPEWRLRPNQVHLEQIGSVDAAEINRVAEWLAALVRREGLPQKLLLVHQFRFSMIRNREAISTPPELAVMIHMDGQGPLSTKYSTWGALTADTEDQTWYWGWKNFFDEDSPVATSEQVLELTPLPLYVSFQ